MCGSGYWTRGASGYADGCEQSGIVALGPRNRALRRRNLKCSRSRCAADVRAWEHPSHLAHLTSLIAAESLGVVRSKLQTNKQAARGGVKAVARRTERAAAAAALLEHDSDGPGGGGGGGRARQKQGCLRCSSWRRRQRARAQYARRQRARRRAARESTVDFEGAHGSVEAESNCG